MITNLRVDLRFKLYLPVSGRRGAAGRPRADQQRAAGVPQPRALQDDLGRGGQGLGEIQVTVTIRASNESFRRLKFYNHREG